MEPSLHRPLNDKNSQLLGKDFEIGKDLVEKIIALIQSTLITSQCAVALPTEMFCKKPGVSFLAAVKHFN